jgi:hypothetical protein
VNDGDEVHVAPVKNAARQALQAVTVQNGPIEPVL